MVILAGLHIVSRDFSDEFPCSGIRVIHKISVKLLTKKETLMLFVSQSHHTVEC